MAAELGVFWSFGGTDDGDSFVGERTSMVSPVTLVTTAGTYRLFRTITLPVNTAAHPFTDPTLLWSYTEGGGDFAFVALQLADGAGTCQISWLADKPTSTTDTTPLGTHKNCGHKKLSCHAPEFFTIAETQVHATAATAVGLDGDGFPSLLTDASTVAGRIYKIWARNDSTTDEVRINLWIRE